MELNSLLINKPKSHNFKPKNNEKQKQNKEKVK